MVPEEILFAEKLRATWLQRVQVYFKQDIHNTDSILFGNLCDWIYILFRNWDWMFHNRRRINLQ